MSALTTTAPERSEVISRALSIISAPTVLLWLSTPTATPTPAYWEAATDPVTKPMRWKFDDSRVRDRASAFTFLIWASVEPLSVATETEPPTATAPLPPAPATRDTAPSLESAVTDRPLA